MVGRSGTVTMGPACEIDAAADGDRPTCAAIERLPPLVGPAPVATASPAAPLISTAATQSPATSRVDRRMIHITTAQTDTGGRHAEPIEWSTSQLSELTMLSAAISR